MTIGKCCFVMDFEASSIIVIVLAWIDVAHTLYGKKHCLQSMELCVMLYNVWIARIAHMIEFNDGVKIVFIRILRTISC